MPRRNGLLVLILLKHFRCFWVILSAPTTREWMDQSRVRNGKYRERADRSAPPRWKKKKTQKGGAAERPTRHTHNGDAASSGIPVTSGRGRLPSPRPPSPLPRRRPDSRDQEAQVESSRFSGGHLTLPARGSLPLHNQALGGPCSCHPRWETAVSPGVAPSGAWGAGLGSPPPPPADPREPGEPRPESRRGQPGQRQRGRVRSKAAEGGGAPEPRGPPPPRSPPPRGGGERLGPARPGARSAPLAAPSPPPRPLPRASVLLLLFLLPPGPPPPACEPRRPETPVTWSDMVTVASPGGGGREEISAPQRPPARQNRTL